MHCIHRLLTIADEARDKAMIALHERDVQLYQKNMARAYKAEAKVLLAKASLVLTEVPSWTG